MPRTGWQAWTLARPLPRELLPGLAQCSPIRAVRGLCMDSCVVPNRLILTTRNHSQFIVVSRPSRQSCDRAPSTHSTTSLPASLRSISCAARSPAFPVASTLGLDVACTLTPRSLASQIPRDAQDGRLAIAQHHLRWRRSPSTLAQAQRGWQLEQPNDVSAVKPPDTRLLEHV